MKKILALVMVIALVCCMLVSCEDAQTVIAKADAALKETPYAVTMKIDFDCDNETVNEIFSVMNMEIPFTVDGDNIAMNLGMDVMGYTTAIDMTVVDKVLYYKMDILGQTLKMKASLNDAQYNEFMEDNSAQMIIDPTDFGTLTIEAKDGKKYIACGEISEEALKKLNGFVTDALGGVGGTTTVSDVTYGVTISDGKYESMEMTCVYSVTVGGETFTTTFYMSAEFSYDNVAKVTAPADADKYTETNFDDILSNLG